ARTIRPIAHDGLEGGLSERIGDLVVLDALGNVDRLLERAKTDIAPAAEIIAERVDALGAGARLVLVKERPGRSHQLVRRHPGLVVEDAVRLGPEPLLERGGLEADHRTTDHLRLVVEL